MIRTEQRNRALLCVCVAVGDITGWLSTTPILRRYYL